MNSLGFIFCHGWGMSPTFWANLAPYFKDYPCLCWDEGYFGDEKKLLPQDNKRWIGVGHSLGFAKLLESQVKFSALIGIQSFLHFCSSDLYQTGQKPRVVHKMASAFAHHPEQVLKNFYQQCGLQAFELQHNLQREKLSRDLQSLETIDGTAQFRRFKQPCLLLATDHDPIVSCDLSLEMAECFDNVKVNIYNGAHHGLGHFDAEKCAMDIKAFLT